MTEPTPPTATPPTSGAATASDEPPISPVSRSGSFPHKTSAGVSTRTPFIDTNTPAINETPVEIDGAEATDTGAAGSKGSARKGSVVSPNLGEEEDINEEFLGEGEQGAGRSIREKRAAMLANRSKDPGVIVDLPSYPTAEEVEAAKSAEGTVTPAIGEGMEGVEAAGGEGEITKR